MPRFGPKKIHKFIKIMSIASANFNIFFLTKFDRYDCLDARSIDDKIPEINVII